MACDDVLMGVGEIVPSPNWKNWSGNIEYVPGRTFRPANRTQLINIILLAESRGTRVKAFGSGWSFSRAATTSNRDFLIDTSLLNRQFESFNRTIRSDPPETLPRVVYVEGGIKVHALNHLLHERGLALPSLGGSAGQSIAGLISTGSHGGDFHLPPFADSVRAIHLVGTNGQEYWIERAERVTDTERLREFLPCAETEIHYDDEMLNAAVVSMGRMGVIYAMVLEVVPQYELHEIIRHWYWSAISRELTMSPSSPDTSFTLPNGNNITLRPILTEEWRYMSALIVPIRDDNGDLTVVLTKRKLFVRSTEDVGERGEESSDVRVRSCKHKNEEGGSAGNPTEFICDAENQGTSAVLAPFIPILRALVNTFEPITRPWWAWLPVVNLFWDIGRSIEQLIKTVEDFERLVSEGNAIPIGEFTSEFINTAVKSSAGNLVYDILKIIVLDSQKEGCVYGWSHSIMDSYSPDTPCLYPVDSIEVAFDGHQTGYQDYIDTLVDKIANMMGRKIAVAGLFAVRFTRQTGALLGAQQFPLTCHVELNMIKGLEGNQEFINFAIERAQGYGGIPHWGFLENLNPSQIRRNFGNRFTVWRRVLTQLAGNRPATFRSAYSLERDLEPLNGCRPSPRFGEFLIRTARSILNGLNRLAEGFRRLSSRG